MNRYKASTLATFDRRLARTYDRSFGPRFCRMGIWDAAIAARLGEDLAGASVLDLGCGSGRLLARLAPHAGRVAGADLAPGILESARARLASLAVPADLRVLDVEQPIPWASASMDVVTCTGVMHHLTDPLATFREVARVLRPSGRFLLVDPTFYPPLRGAFNALLRIGPIAGDRRFYSEDEAARLLARAGLDVTRGGRVARWSFLLEATAVRTAQIPASQ